MKVKFDTLPEVVETLEEMINFLDKRTDYLYDMDLVESFETHIELYHLIQSVLDKFYKSDDAD